jgi:hypothetical protein
MPGRGKKKRRFRINRNPEQPEKPMKPDLPKATQGQVEAGPASSEIEPHVAESFLAGEPSSNGVPLQLTGETPVPLPLDGCEHQERVDRLKEAPVPAVTDLSGETPDAATGTVALPGAVPEAGAPIGRSERELTEALRRAQILARIDALVAAGCPIGDARAQAGISASTHGRWRKRLAERGSLISDRNKSGRKPLVDLTDAEKLTLQQLYLKMNKDEESGSMRSAAKFLALDPETREEVRGPILAALATSSKVPGFVKRVLERVTAAHVSARRRPQMSAVEHFSGRIGAFAGDKIERRRVIEADDGTLNFPMWIPWPMGGDKCSDKFNVRLGRWQFLPEVEAGWSYFTPGYALVCRPKGSYRDEDIRALIHMVGQQYGLPDLFRFERGSWESNAIVHLLEQIGVPLQSVHQSNHKPIVEGNFSPIWTYLGVVAGQMGRYRGEMEEENKLYEKCKDGRADPREHFVSLADGIAAIDGAVAMRNSDTVRSNLYGSWVPEVRWKEHALSRPWKPLPAELSFLFAPYVREWTVAKGSVGGGFPLIDGYNVPLYFASEDLYQWNGKKVRLYVDPAAEQCTATIVSLGDYHGFRPGEVICRAELVDGLPHHARACFGWGEEQTQRANQSIKIARAACMRQVRVLSEAGQVKASVSEARDGGGNVVRVSKDGTSNNQHPTTNIQARETRANVQRSTLNAQRSTALSAPTAEQWAKRRARLAEQAEATQAITNDE